MVWHMWCSEIHKTIYQTEWKCQVTHGFMLKRSLPTSGFAIASAWLFSLSLSVQVAVPPSGEAGDVGEEAAFLRWISCTCFVLETATDWERDIVTRQCDREQRVNVKPVVGGKSNVLPSEEVKRDKQTATHLYTNTTGRCFPSQSTKRQGSRRGGIKNQSMRLWKAQE